MLNDWDATRDMITVNMLKEGSHAYRAGYEAAGVECLSTFKRLTFANYQQDWLSKMIDALLMLCEVENWDNPRDRGRLQGFIDIKDGTYASPNAS